MSTWTEPDGKTEPGMLHCNHFPMRVNFHFRFWAALLWAGAHAAPCRAALPTDAKPYPAREFVELAPFETIPDDIIRWDPDSGRYLYVLKDGGILPIKGWLTPHYELFFEDQRVPVNANGHFEIPIRLASFTKVLHLRVLDPERRAHIYSFVYFWHKLPPLLRLRVQPFAQLYSGARPTEVVDLDAIRGAQLTFRFYIPPNVKHSCDSWDLIVERIEGGPAIRVSQIGFPPPYLEWTSLGRKLALSGEYHYHLVLNYGGKPIDGGMSTFHAFAGSRTFRHDYAPALVLEPRQETGYFTFSDGKGVAFSSAFLGADIAAVLWQRFLVRAAGITSLEGMNPTGGLTFVRVGAGMRFFGYDDDSWVGRPFLFQLDALAGYSTYALSPSLSYFHFDAFSALLQPKFVFWSRHQIIPWIEYGLKPPNYFQRVSGGLLYQYFIRSWSLALGLGAAFDKALVFEPHPSARFQIVRAFATVSFYL